MLYVLAGGIWTNPFLFFMIQSGFSVIGGVSWQPRPQPTEQHHRRVAPPSSPAPTPHQSSHPGTPSSPAIALRNAHLPVQPFLKHQPATPLVLFRKWVITPAIFRFFFFLIFLSSLSLSLYFLLPLPFFLALCFFSPLVTAVHSEHVIFHVTFTSFTDGKTSVNRLLLHYPWWCTNSWKAELRQAQN